MGRDIVATLKHPPQIEDRLKHCVLLEEKLFTSGPNGCDKGALRLEHAFWTTGRKEIRVVLAPPHVGERAGSPWNSSPGGNRVSNVGLKLGQAGSAGSHGDEPRGQGFVGYLQALPLRRFSC